jgi:DNA-binding transcriptional MerR regulator
MMHEHLYTTTQVAEITGFSLRQLDYWARKMMIIPSFQQAEGSGSRRLYTAEDLVKLNIVRQLKKHNWSTQKIRHAVETLKEIMNDTNPLRNAILIHGKGTIFALSKTKTGEHLLIDALSTTGQQVMSFVLETLLEEVKSTTSAPVIHKPLSADEIEAGVAQAGGQELCH